MIVGSTYVQRQQSSPVVTESSLQIVPGLLQCVVELSRGIGRTADSAQRVFEIWEKN